MSRDHQFYLIAKHFHHPKRKPHARTREANSCPFSFPLVAWQPPIRILSPWTYRFWTFQRNGILQHVAFCVSAFRAHYVFKVCTMYQYFFPFYGQMIFQSMDLSPSYTFFCDGHLDCFHLLATVNRAPTNICVPLFESLTLIVIYTYLCIYLGVEFLCTVNFFMVSLTL